MKCYSTGITNFIAMEDPVNPPPVIQPEVHNDENQESPNFPSEEDPAISATEVLPSQVNDDIAIPTLPGEECDPPTTSEETPPSLLEDSVTLAPEENSSTNTVNSSSSMLGGEVMVDRPKTPENISSSSTPVSSSPVTPRDGVPPLVGIEGYSSSASTSSTPRDESSSGSPSPIPDDVHGKILAKDKPRVKLGKDLSLMMQALNSLQSPEEKIAALCKKYADLLDQQKLQQKQLRLSQRKQAQALKEKDQSQSETNKAILARTKLESLCRELQKRNKAIKEEQNQKSLEEVNLRQEMATNFQTKLNSIQNQMKTAMDGSTKLHSENERIGGRLNEIVEKTRTREAAMEDMLKQSHISNEVANAKLEKALLEHQLDKQNHAAEKQTLMQQVLDRTVMYETKLKQEKELRAQLQYYSEKFEDFQATLEKSNEIFTSFRSEMDKMSKKLKQAEKHRATIQKKWEDSTKALADTVDYTQQLEAKQARLEKLSRALQSERNELVQRLRQYEDKNKKIKDSKRKHGKEEQMKESENVKHITEMTSKTLSENTTGNNHSNKVSPHSGSPTENQPKIVEADTETKCGQDKVEEVSKEESKEVDPPVVNGGVNEDANLHDESNPAEEEIDEAKEAVASSSSEVVAVDCME